MESRVILFASPFLAMSLLLGGCAGTTEGGAVGAEPVSSQQLEQMSARSYTALLQDASKKGVLNTDGALAQRVRAVAGRITPHTGVFRADAPGWKWEVNVIDGDELDLFCMPGGRIILYSGLIRQLDLNDDEIAVVMGHEIAHALREHSREQVSQAIAADPAARAVSRGASDGAGTEYQALLATRFSRTDETAADRIGLELAARAGYDPRAGISLWQKMLQANQFLSTHPAQAGRIRQIQSLLPTVTPVYQQARR